MTLLKENIDLNNRIVFLGESGFPMGLATIQRITLMSKAFIRAGHKVTVVCRKGVWKENAYPDLGYKGNYEGIDYIYTSKSTYKPKGFIRRNIMKLKGVYGEYKYLKRLNKEEKIGLAVISDFKVVHILRYKIYSALLGFPIATNFVEMASSMQHRAKFLKRINDHVLDKWIIKLFDGALPISDKLMEYYNEMQPSKPNMKLPIICDFKKFEVSKKSAEPYFLYCGSFRYKEVRDFVIEAYKSIAGDNHTKLYMIVSGGSKEETEQLQKEINSEYETERILLFANIPYEQLVQLYIDATALLIPLRPTVQDASRFPHKIGEYLASANPVITTDIGEIKNYFEDGETALIAATYDVAIFADKMKYVLDNPEVAKKIGSNGKELGLKEFDYKAHGERLQAFLQDLSRQ